MLNTKINLNKNKGFTLVELLVVIIILSVISSVSIPVYLNYNNKSRESATKIEMSSVAKALSLFQADNEDYPSDTASLSAYLKSIPVKDSFKIDYVYEASDDLSSYTFTSFGIDKTEGTGDDIVFEDGIMIKQGKYAVAEEEDSALYESDFSTMDGIKIIKGDGWTIKNNKLTAITTGKMKAIFNGTNGKDYTIQTNAVLNSGQSYGIYYRAKEYAIAKPPENSISGYLFQFDPGLFNTFNVKKVINGIEVDTPIKKVNMPAGFDINAIHDIEIEILGERQVIKVDGNQIMDFSDNTFTEGIVGVKVGGTAANPANIEFNKVTVTEK